MGATRKHHVPRVVRPHDDGAELKQRIWDAGYHCQKVYRHYPPPDDGCAEVLFRGHERGCSDADQKYRCLTAWLPKPSGETIIVSERW